MILLQCILLIVAVAFTTIVQTGFVFADDVIKNDEMQENSTEQHNYENSDIEYEKEATSWRFQDGLLIHKDREKTGNVIAPKARAKASFVPWSEVDGKFINSNGEVIEGAVRKGIDVSEWQGNIDWEKVKASGIDFAIIRCGYGMNDVDQDDSKWARNVRECERLDIPYGVYIYSYADSDAKAKSEAQHVIRLLKGHSPDYPVYYDLEDKIVKACGKTAIVRRAQIFCNMIEEAGYEAGIYANLDWWNNILNNS